MVFEIWKIRYPKQLFQNLLEFEKFGSFTNRENINRFLKKNKNYLKINFFRNKGWDIKQKNFKMPKIK